MSKNNQMKQSNKATYAAYLNMALHNFYLIINHIKNRLGQDLLKGEAQLADQNTWQVFFYGKNKSPEDTLAVVRLLAKRFPFINANDKPELLKEFLETAYSRLNTERNEHSHFYHGQVAKKEVKGSSSSDTDFDLKKCITTAKSFLKQKIEDGIERQQPIEETYKGDPEQKPKQLYRELGATALAEFITLQFPLYREDGKEYTELGLAFFTTLFLEKKYAAQFLSKVPFLKFHPNEKTARLYKEWCWAFCCRLPQPKLASGEVSMDILNELYRAPKNLYNFLSEANKEQFEVDFHHDNETLMLELGNQKSILKRQEDRFPYLAMKVMDDSQFFEQLRFQVHLGKWLRKEYASNSIEERKIHENLRGFGHLGYFVEDNAPTSWKATEAEESALDEEGKPKWHLASIEQFAPHYLVTGNRVGIRINRGKAAADWLELEKYEPFPEENKAAQARKAILFQPDAILSTYELPNLFFYQYLYDKTKNRYGKRLISQSAEVFIRNYINEFKRFCKDVTSGVVRPIATTDFGKKSRRPNEPISDKNQYSEEEWEDLEDRKDKLQLMIDSEGYQINQKDLPDSVREYLLGYDIDEEEALRQKIINRKKETEQLKRQLDRAIATVRLKEGSIPAHLSNEKLAPILVEDILVWRPIDKSKTQYTQRNADLLKQLLVNFPHNKQALEEHIMGKSRGKKLPRSMRLVDKTYPFAHPFLDKVNLLDQQDLRELAYKYLQEKAKWLKQLLQPAGRRVSKPDAYFRTKLKDKKVQQVVENELAIVKNSLPAFKTFLKQQKKVVGDSTHLQNGDLATYLVKDMIFLKPRAEGEKNFGKPNNQEYKRLHSMLAMYSVDKLGLIAFLEELGLMGKGKKHPHPFLNRTQPTHRQGIKEFYEAYLKEKIKWMDDLLKELKKGKTEKTLKYYGHTQSKKKVTEKNYSDIPVLLPRGLFNAAIQQALIEHTDLEITEEDNLVRCLEKYVDKDTQPFYELHRIYSMTNLDRQIVWMHRVADWEDQFDFLKKAIEKLEKSKAAKKDGKLKAEKYQELMRLKKLKRKAQSNEQKIRYHQHTDRILLLMLRMLAKEKRPEDAFYLDVNKLELTAIKPKDRNLKAQELPTVGSKKGNLLSEPMVMEIEIHGKKVIDVLSTKRHGEFRRFFKDKRIQDLLKYYDASNTQKEELIKLLGYWEQLPTVAQAALLRYLKSTPTQATEAAAKDGLTSELEQFNATWRAATIQYFDKDTFEIAHLRQLLAKMEKTTILRRQLVKELDYYDNNRDVLFDKILAFEEKVYEVLPVAFHQKMAAQKSGKQHLLAHRPILELVQEALNGQFSTTLLHELNEFRKSIAHNEVYYSDFLKEKIIGENGKIIAPLLKHIERTYHWLITELDKQAATVTTD